MSDKESDKCSKQEHWDATMAKVMTWTDTLGKGIESGILEMVVACNVLGFHTAMSCEGHVNWGMPAPWVRIDAPNKPRERFIGEQAILAEVANKHGVAVRDLFKRKNDALHREAIDLAMQNGETEEYKVWRRQSVVMNVRMRTVLKGFYRGRTVDKAIELVMDEGGGVINAGAASLWIARTRCGRSAEERLSAEYRLRQYRAEMNEFAQFLKTIYFK